MLIRQDRQQTELLVTDDGTGITEEQASDPRSLGIVGMRERVLSAGGRVDISGQPGAGTTVRVLTPAAPEAEAMIKVLIADDHAVVREGLKQILAEMPDVSVAGEAANGHEVLDRANPVPWSTSCCWTSRCRARTASTRSRS